MDVLADVLAIARIGATVVARADLVAPWALVVDPMAEAHVHVVQRGACWLRTSAAPRPLRLEAGDVVLLRSGIGHALGDSPRTPPRPYRQVLDEMPARVARLPAAAREQTTRVLCAKYLLPHAGPHPLTALLPPSIHLPAAEVARHAELELLLRLLGYETATPRRGAELVVPRLVDSLLVLVIRAWLADGPAEAPGFAAALREPALARALSCIHRAPEEAWTVAALAREAAQSRATFARRFLARVGEPPLAYLTRWRMCVAAKLLAETELSLDEIAPRVGYDTAAALAKAFRRVHAVTPGRYRTETRRARITGSIAPGA